MALTVSEKGGSNRPLTPAGTHLARCYKLIDLGTQHDEYLGKPKIQQKVMLYWELPNERAVFKDGGDEQPYSISKEYTASLGEKANLRHDLEGWRGRAFTEEELKGFDLKNVVGHPCLITVVHKKSRDGKKTYDQVSSVAAIPRDSKTKKPTMDVPKAENATVVYDIADGENNVFAELPEWIQKKIKECEEWNGSGKPTGGESYHDPDPDSEDIPFSSEEHVLVKNLQIAA